MAHIIKKKLINEDLLFSDDFDESTLDQMEESLCPRSPDEGLPDSEPDQQDIGGAKEWPEQPVELDDGTVHTDSEQRTSVIKKGENSKQEFQPGIASRQIHQGSNRMSSSKTIMLFSAALLILMLTAGTACLLWPNALNPGTENPVAPRPIEVPKHEREVTFLILASSLEKSDLLKLDMEFAFMSLNGYERFMDNQIFYHDLIYSHLISQQPPENSVQNWERILENALLEALKRQCPDIRLNSIRLKSFQRL